MEQEVCFSKDITKMAYFMIIRRCTNPPPKYVGRTQSCIMLQWAVHRASRGLWQNDMNTEIDVIPLS
jgi:hypothetical protein